MAQRVETGDGWELRLGDCLDPVTGLASLEAVDHVITDPPYEIEAHTKARRQSSGPDTLAEEYAIDFSAIDPADRLAFGLLCRAVCSGWALVFCQVEAVEAWRSALGGKWRRGMAWVKPDGTPQFTGDRPAQGFECMALAWMSSGRSRWNGGGKRGVYTCNVNDYGRKERGLHPTQKPLALMEELLRDFTNPRELVCDPFAGSATTGVACIRLGRRFIGWEKDPGYFETAVKRLRAARPQGDLFDRAGFDGKPQTLPGVE